MCQIKHLSVGDFLNYLSCETFVYELNLYTEQFHERTVETEHKIADSVWEANSVRNQKCIFQVHFLFVLRMNLWNCFSRLFSCCTYDLAAATVAPWAKWFNPWSSVPYIFCCLVPPLSLFVAISNQTALLAHQSAERNSRFYLINLLNSRGAVLGRGIFIVLCTACCLSLAAFP